MSLITICALPATSCLGLGHAIPVDNGTITAKTTPQNILTAGLMSSNDYTSGTSTVAQTISASCLYNWINSATTSVTGGCLVDANTYFTNSSTPSKKIKFTVAGISPNTTRTLTIQDANGTVALLSNNLGSFAATTSSQLASIIPDETGTGSLVFGTSPTLTTASFNTSLTGATGSTLVLTADSVNTSFPISFGSSVTPLAQIKGYYDSPTAGHLEFYTTTGSTSVEQLRIGPNGQIGVGGAVFGSSGQVLMSNGGSGAPSWSTFSLSAFNGTTSSQLANIISDETGTGSLVFGTSPTLTTASFNTSLTGTTGSTLVLTADSVNTSFPISFGSSITPLAQIKGFYDSATSGHLSFYTTTGSTSVERVRITPSGNVGINTTTPSQALDVNGNINVTGSVYGVNKSSSDTITYGSNLITTNSGDWALGTGFSTLDYITFTSNYSSSSLLFKPAGYLGYFPHGLYQLSVTTNITSGTINVLDPSSITTTLVNGTNTITLSYINNTSTGTPFTFTSSSFVGSIYNITLKSVNSTLFPSLLLYDSTNTLKNSITVDKNTSNTFIGLNAGASNICGSCNIAIGDYALSKIYNGGGNIAIGKCAATNLKYNTTNNIAIGNNALSLSTGISGAGKNVAIGENSLLKNSAIPSGFTIVKPGSGMTPGTRVCTLYNLYGTPVLFPGTTTVIVNSMGCVTSANTNGNNYGWEDRYSTVCGDGGFVLCATTLSYEGLFNTAIGYYSMCNNTTGYYNVAVGGTSLANNLTGSHSTAVGYSALCNNTTGCDNVALGSMSMYDNTSGSMNVALGSNSLYSNTVGIQNVAIGHNSLMYNSTGCYEVAIGSYAMSVTNGACNNVAIGSYAMAYLPSCASSGNIAIGGFALNQSYCTSLGNIAIGCNSLMNVNGCNNIVLGQNSLTMLDTNCNTILSTQGLSTNSNNIAIGANICLTYNPSSCNYYQNATLCNSITIGNGLTLNGVSGANSYTTTIGHSTTCKATLIGQCLEIGLGSSTTASYLSFKPTCSSSYTYPMAQIGGYWDSSSAGHLEFYTTSGTTPTERFRIGSAGQLGIGGATYGSSGQFLISGGASAAPAWSYGSAPVTVSTTTYTVSATDESLVVNNASTITITLPAAASYSGRKLIIKSIGAGTVVSASTNVVPLSSATAGTSILSASGKWAKLISDGVNWVIMMAN